MLASFEVVDGGIDGQHRDGVIASLDSLYCQVIPGVSAVVSIDELVFSRGLEDMGQGADVLEGGQVHIGALGVVVREEEENGRGGFRSRLVGVIGKGSLIEVSLNG